MAARSCWCATSGSTCGCRWAASSSRARPRSRPPAASCARRPAWTASSRRGWASTARPPGLIGYEEHPAGSKGLHLNFAFVADVATRELAACDEYTAVRWVGDPVPVECPLNVRQLVRLALAAPNGE